MTAGPHADPPAAGARGADVLDTSPRPLSRRVVVAGALVLAVLVAVGWLDLRGPEPAVPIAAPVTTAADRPGSGERPGPRAVREVRTDRAGQLTFVDDRIGFLVQERCRDASCVRRVLATEDGGRSWQPRGELPTAARFLDRFVVTSGTDLAFLGGDPPATIAYSADGGRTWAVRALSRGEARPAASGAPIVTDSSPPCPATVCTPWLAWVDVVAAQLHRLPGDLATDGLVGLTAAGPGPDGELLVTAVRTGEARVWASADGGRSWQSAALPGPTDAGLTLTRVRAFAAGDGRCYAYLVAAGSARPVAVTGFRSDDGGRTWSRLGPLPTGLALPDGVLDGELVTTDVDGLIHQSVQGGRAWQPRSILLGDGTLRQAVSGGQVLATVIDVSGLVTYYRSPDVRSWSGVNPPST